MNIHNLSVLVVIPVYNHGDKLGAVLDGCLRFFGPEDILVVDDGSTDNSSVEAQKRMVHLRKHQTNLGKGRALITGFDFAIERSAAWVLTLDADGQHLPEEIPQFLEAAESGKFAFIIGNRKKTPGKMPLHRICSNVLTSKLLSKVTGQNIPDSQSGYRMIQTELIKRMHFQSYDFILETEMILSAVRLGAKLRFVPISTVYRDEKSHMRNTKTMEGFIKTIYKNRKRYMQLLSKKKE
jgi:glycosyltransferase involved in cell wall biosynthesis